MTRLPVIVGFGGFNAAGRSSFHHSYQRIVIDSLSQSKRQETLSGLAVMMNLLSDGELKSLSPAQIEAKYGQSILENTLIRTIGSEYFDVNKTPTQQKIKFIDNGQALQFELSKRHLPDVLPHGWIIEEQSSSSVKVTVSEETHFTVDSHYVSPVQSAGQLPGGFSPADMYASRFHPRGLQLAVIGASDALNSMGVDWDAIRQSVSPDEIGAYSSGLMGQLDEFGYGGLLQSRLKGQRVSTKNLALGLSSMPSDFVNAYVLGNIGSTASLSGACASYLYNLRAAVNDIQSGKRRVVVVGGSEAPITPEIIDGYGTMGALATVDKLCKIDGSSTTDLRRSSRPFAENCGFVIGESTQHVVLMDDELALELGANIHGAVSDVFINADGYKKSISAPGPGNFLTMAKAVASARSLLGDESVQRRSFIQAHGSSTPQNRTTESEILDKVAKAFGIESWPVAAVKAYVGHSLAPASGDQLINSLGVFDQGILPGIKTIDGIADDVYQDRLAFSIPDTQLENPMEVAFLNSKGFGGNNATACILSPSVTEQMLSKRHGSKVMSSSLKKRENTLLKAEHYNQEFMKGNYSVIYKFGEDMIGEKEIDISPEKIRIDGFDVEIDLTQENLYKDMI